MKKGLTLSLILLVLTGCSHLSRSPAGLDTDLPNREAFLGWQEHDNMTDKRDLRSIPHLTVACSADPFLYPTHPQQTMKLYHDFRTGRYDANRITADDPGCLIAQATPGSTGRRLCLKSDTIEAATLSDTYMDGCGKPYRAFWKVSFFKRDENMGTLMAPGRTMYPDPHSEFQGDMVVGQTYPVRSTDFDFVSDLFPGDLEKIIKERETALQYTHRFDPNTRVFEPKTTQN